MVSFAAWILICSYVELDPLTNVDQYALLSLCEHATNLGPEIVRQAAALVYWAYLAIIRIPNQREFERLFYLLSLLLLSSATKGLLSSNEFVFLYTQLSKEEKELRQRVMSGDYFLPYDVGPLWVLGLEGVDMNNFQDRFRSVLLRMLATQKEFGNKKEANLLTRIIKGWDPSKVKGTRTRYWENFSPSDMFKMSRKNKESRHRGPRKSTCQGSE